jgi:hypothetical protein
VVVTQDLRDEGAVVSSIYWKKRPGPRYRVCFRLTRTDRVEVSAVDASDRVVRVLASTQPLEGGDAPHCFDWDGRTDAGQAAPAGSYHLQLTLEEADRTAVSGERVNISPIRAARTARGAP